MTKQKTPYIVTGHDDSTSPSGLRADLANVFDALVAQLDALNERVAALEAELESSASVIAFAERRASWTARQLAADLNVHPNTVLNWLALPADHPRHLDSFQPGGTGPHMILPEHVADWISRNGRTAA